MNSVIPQGDLPLKVIEASQRDTMILKWRFSTWVIFFVPLRFQEYKKGREPYIVECVNSPSCCFNSPA